VIPAGTAPEPGAVEVELIGRKLPEWVVAEKGGEKVRFRLITASPGPPVPPFYVMESKVTNRLYAAAGKEARLTLPAQPEPVNDLAPVVNVTAFEAREFAQKVFGGDLPSADEWDHAAGFFDQRGQATPTLPPGRAWVGKPTPGPVKRANPDVNRYGLLDMAGNGREWTHTIFIGIDPQVKTEKFILRGRMFTLERPLSYTIMEKERTGQPQAATPDVGSPYTSFRVVLPLP
jgi:hypothetical protein